MDNGFWFVFDVDGVITDGRIWVNEYGESCKCMNLKDIDAIHEIVRLGYPIVAVTAEKNSFTSYIKSSFLWTGFYDGVENKSEALLSLCQKFDISENNIVYIGDGKKDLPAFQHPGIFVCPADAIKDIRDRADIVLNAPAGAGGLWELVRQVRDNGICKSATFHTAGAVCGVDAAEIWKTSLTDHLEIVKRVERDAVFGEQVACSAEMIAEAIKNGKKVLVFGNGGSAADAQHIAAEFMGKFGQVRAPWNMIALTTNTSLLTAVANDFAYKFVFSRQVLSLAAAGDVVIGITTSGTSENVLLALETAKQAGAHTVLLTGEAGNPDLSDCTVSVPAKYTPNIQEMHILIGHYWARYAETVLCGHGLVPME